MATKAIIEKAQKIQAILDDLYPTTPIPLDHTDPFTLLVAVVLSAQTTDKKVNEVTPALFSRAPNPERMSALSVDEIREIIRQIGLAPQKAKALQGLSSLLISRHGGQVPSTFEELEALPGVGHKTASVVMSQAFGVPAFPVDTHIHRLASRWGLADGSNVTNTERSLKELFDRSSWNKLHLQIIFFGREYCPALRHDTMICPICSFASTTTSQKRPASKTPRTSTPRVKTTAKSATSPTKKTAPKKKSAPKKKTLSRATEPR